MTSLLVHLSIKAAFFLLFFHKKKDSFPHSTQSNIDKNGTNNEKLYNKTTKLKIHIAINLKLSSS